MTTSNARTRSRPGDPGTARDAASWLVLVAIVVVAALVRWSVIGRDALWLDEGYSWWDAQQRYGALWSLVPTCDPHPPLYFALLHLWRSMVGDGTVALRVLSLLFGVATVVLVYLAGREIDRRLVAGREIDRPFVSRRRNDPPSVAGRDDRERVAGRDPAAIGSTARPRLFGVGSFAALLFALTPFQVYFSVEARPYALLCFGAALLTLAVLRIVRAIETPSRRLAFAWTERIAPGDWALLVAGACIVVWTNNTAVLVLGAVSAGFLALWTFDRPSRAVVVPIVAAGVLVAVLWAPDWPLLIAQAREVTGEFWIPKPSFSGIEFELHNLIGLDVLRATWWVALAVVGGLALIARRVGWRWGLMIAALAVLPIAFNVAISFAMKPILISRALIGAAPALALALAAAVVLQRAIGLRVLLAVMLAAAHVVSVGRYLGADHVKEPWRPVVVRLAVATSGTAPVLVVPNELAMPLAHEAAVQRIDMRVRGLPADYPATDVKARYPSGKCAPSVVGQDFGPLMRELQREPVVVLLTRLNNTYDPGDSMIATLRSAGFRVEHDDVFQPGDLRVLRFVRAS